VTEAAGATSLRGGGIIGGQPRVPRIWKRAGAVDGSKSWIYTRVPGTRSHPAQDRASGPSSHGAMVGGPGGARRGGRTPGGAENRLHGVRKLVGTGGAPPGAAAETGRAPSPPAGRCGVRHSPPMTDSGVPRARRPRARPGKAGEEDRIQRSRGRDGSPTPLSRSPGTVSASSSTPLTRS